MPVLTSERPKKRNKIRFTEYYDLQSTFDKLYADSLKSKSFSYLIDLITSDENIKLAYRTIKRNKGSNTAGVDKRTIKHLAKLSEEKFVSLIKRQFTWYKARPVRRVEIPKPNGKLRPLGIPTIVDRIVQQCILQVLEPICEARFNDNSSGFRPNRGTKNAIAQCNRLMQVCHLHFVVDIDIQGFFDNVDHNKLINQMWNMGIRDKKLLCIIKEMLKAPIVLPNGKTIMPTKGTPQGGILSPLLSNIVLNELDWWVSSQWETFETKYQYKCPINPTGSTIRSNIYRAMRISKLKEMHIVRYADDFKIFCPDHETAIKAFEATQMWLKDRLKLKISPEKSKVINLRKCYSEFLGFKMKVSRKGKKLTIRPCMSDKAKAQTKEMLSNRIKAMQHPSDEKAEYQALQKYNSAVMGLQNYYCLATAVSKDFAEINFGIRTQLHIRLGELTKKGKLERGYLKMRYGKSKQLRYLHGHPIAPIAYVQTKEARQVKKGINRYTPEGRELIHKNLGINTEIMLYLMRNPITGKSIEYADNRISLYAAQYGKCAVSGKFLEVDEIHCHHKLPRELGGRDDYENLVIVNKDIHILIHATSDETIDKYLKKLKLNKAQITKLNRLRQMAENETIA